ncbi:hypothetical protein SGRA_0232 [Saprospira grandis str. Lewin]|uniref:Uncharacterized protein n=1 Tax=Saprospira grandis (strain Lewin) TaxID=984262 RepID=H6L670_SAPGL|nr:hypothetical protein SGRA_0232 [Saprospira grandis str. Lewin]
MDPNLAAAFKLQLWPKAKRPSDAKGGGEAADQGRQAAGPSRPASPEA